MSTHRRVHLLDETRGFIVILMVLYHMLYDISALTNIKIPFDGTALLEWVHLFVACIFMFIAGIMCRFSRSNLRRGALCLALAFGIGAFTQIFVPSQAIIFGVLHFLGASMLIFGLAEKYLYKIPPIVGIAISALLLLFTEPISLGYLGFGSLRIITLPKALYSTNTLASLGIYASNFFSADYYPLLPWFFVFLMGAYLGVYFTEGAAPEWFYKMRSKVLAFVGQNALIIYIVHQPVLFLLLYPVYLLLQM